MLTIISANLYNFTGSKDGNPKKAKAELTQFLSGLARETVATLVCTQEDNDGLQIEGFKEVGMAGSNFEVVRVYGREGMDFTTTTIALVEGGTVAARDAIVVTTPGGLKVANVFMSGGKYEDRNFESAPQARKEAAEQLVGLNVLVGDWNADVDPNKEKTKFSQTSEYVKELKFDSSKLQRWLEWRQSPFEVLRNAGYEALWPTERTVSFNLAVDGAWYGPTLLDRVDVVVKDEMLGMSDHAAVVVRFRASEESFWRSVYKSIYGVEASPDEVATFSAETRERASQMCPEPQQSMQELILYVAEALERDIVIDREGDDEADIYPCFLHEAKRAVLLEEQAGTFALRKKWSLDIFDMRMDFSAPYLNEYFVGQEPSGTFASWIDAINTVKQQALDLVAKSPHVTSLFDVLKSKSAAELESDGAFRFEVSFILQRHIALVNDGTVWCSRPRHVTGGPLIFKKVDSRYHLYGEANAKAMEEPTDIPAAAERVLQDMLPPWRERARFLAVAVASHKEHATLGVRLSYGGVELDDYDCVLCCFLAAFKVCDGDVDKLDEIPALSINTLRSKLKKEPADGAYVYF